MSTISERIKQLRKALKLTQTEFANKLGVTMRGLQLWEHGHSGLKESSLRLMETLFNVNPEWLREGKGEMFNADMPACAGSRIKELRKYLKLNQTEFANKLGITMQGLQLWEYGKSGIKESSLRLIESQFDVNPEWLREGKGEMFMTDEALQKTVNQMGLKSITDIPEERIPKYAGYYINKRNIEEPDGKQEDLVLALFRALPADKKVDVLKYMYEKYQLEKLTGQTPAKDKKNA